MQGSSPSAESLPYVVLRGDGRTPTYKRRIPPDLRALIGSTTITARLRGHPHGTVAERREFLAAYSRAHEAAEQRIQRARSQQGARTLSATEQLGVAGRWAALAPPQSAEAGLDSTEAMAVLQALEALQIVLPTPLSAGWRVPVVDAPDDTVVETVQAMAHRIEGIPHPSFWGQPGEVLYGEPSRQRALVHLQQVVTGRHQEILRWIREARQQVAALGLVLEAKAVQTVALRLATTAVRLSQQTAAIEAGQLPDPLPAFPPPPTGDGPHGGRLIFDDALDRWVKLRRPAVKTRIDAAARLRELSAHVGHNRLELLTPAEVSGWRDALLEGGTASTAKRKLAMVRAVFGAAAGDGLPLQGGVVERLASRGLRDATGTRRERRPFSEAEAAVLWRVAREQTGPRPLDRWAFPLGLALGCRLEELAGLRREDVRQVDDQWLVEIQPTEQRRLKTNSSSRQVPIPKALVREGFTGWAMGQGEGLLFPEPPPPAGDPRLSHYASVRLSKILRGQAGINDPAAVFHGTRHFTAQQLVDAGCEQRVIEQILGHSSRSMTARYSRGGVPLALLASAMEARTWGWVPQAR
ncbi:MAG: tyrosine-type recombinase/integrase [Cyanobacteriota bacterium]